MSIFLQMALDFKVPLVNENTYQKARAINLSGLSVYCVEKSIAVLAEKVQLNQKISVGLNPDLFQIIIHAGHAEGTSYVIIPPLCLIDRKEVPFTGPDDPQLNNQENLQNFSHWISNAFALPRKSVTFRDRLFLKLFLKMSEKPHEFKEGYKFVLLHELGHLAYQHKRINQLFWEKMRTPFYLIINFLSLGVFAFLSKLKLSQKNEKEADDFACKHASEDMAKGGIYVFDTTRNFRSNKFSERIFHFLFCAYLALTHTSFKARSRRIQDYLSKK